MWRLSLLCTTFAVGCFVVSLWQPEMLKASFAFLGVAFMVLLIDLMIPR